MLFGSAIFIFTLFYSAFFLFYVDFVMNQILFFKSKFVISATCFSLSLAFPFSVSFLPGPFHESHHMLMKNRNGKTAEPI